MIDENHNEWRSYKETQLLSKGFHILQPWITPSSIKCYKLYSFLSPWLIVKKYEEPWRHKAHLVQGGLPEVFPMSPLGAKLITAM